jgi:hypothetical protein
VMRSPALGLQSDTGLPWKTDGYLSFYADTEFLVKWNRVSAQ